MNRFSEFEQGNLPIGLTFAVAYLDGVMEDELPEIAKQWRKVRDFVQTQALLPASIDVVGKAREEEREACAKAAEDHVNEKNAHPEYNMAAWDIAAAIRARTALASLTGEGL